MPTSPADMTLWGSAVDLFAHPGYRFQMLSDHDPKTCSIVVVAMGRNLSTGEVIKSRAVSVPRLDVAEQPFATTYLAYRELLDELVDTIKVFEAMGA